MWRKDGRIVQYVYHPDQPENYGEDFFWKLSGTDSRFVLGQWHHVETCITMNTPGKNNGTLQSWLDGSMVLETTELRFRDVPELGIDLFYWSTFYGGNDPAWSPKGDQRILFDGFVISTERVGE